MPEGQVLEFDRVTKRFGDVTAVSDLSVRVEPGVVTGFLGPNGAGKTTTLRILLGQIRPTSGSATIGGSSYSELRNPLRTVGAVLEEAAYRPRRSATRQLLIAAKANGIPTSRVSEVLRLVGLQDDADTRLGSYSLGMRQRLAVASALLGDPGVLVLDEPANGLDPEGIRWMRLLMRRLADEGRTVLVSSHVLSEIEQVADNVVVLSKGRAVYSGAIDELADPSGGAVIVDATNRASLITALSAAKLSFDVLRSGVTVRDSDAASVGAVTAAAGIPLTMLQQRGPSLEDVFLDLVYGRRADSPRLDQVANPVAHAPSASAAAPLAAAPLGAAAAVSDAATPDAPDAEPTADSTEGGTVSDDVAATDSDLSDTEAAALPTDTPDTDDADRPNDADDAVDVDDADGTEDAPDAVAREATEPETADVPSDDATGSEDFAEPIEATETAAAADITDSGYTAPVGDADSDSVHEHPLAEEPPAEEPADEESDEHAAEDAASPTPETTSVAEAVRSLWLPRDTAAPAPTADAEPAADADADADSGADSVSDTDDTVATGASESHDVAQGSSDDTAEADHAEPDTAEADTAESDAAATDDTASATKAKAKAKAEDDTATDSHTETAPDTDERDADPVLPLATQAVSIPTASEPSTFTELITGIPASALPDGDAGTPTEAIAIFSPLMNNSDDEDSSVDDDDDDPRLAAMRTSLSSAASRFFDGPAPDYPYSPVSASAKSEPADGQQPSDSDADTEQDEDAASADSAQTDGERPEDHDRH